MVTMNDWTYKFFERANIGGKKMWVCHVLKKDETNEKGRRLPGTAVHSTNAYKTKSQCVQELRELGIIKE